MSKAAATRWLASNVGRQIDTHQVATSGRVWQPGTRVLRMTGGTFTLDGSRVTLTRQHVVTAIDADSFTVEWRDDDGSVIHATTYTLATVAAEVTVTAGYVCKQCNGPAPVGIGYVDHTPGAAERSAGITSCPCGYSAVPS